MQRTPGVLGRVGCCLFFTVSYALSAEAPEQIGLVLSGIWDFIGFALLGSAIVFTTLVGLWGICSLVGRCFTHWAPPQAATSPQPQAIDPQVVAVISAAVATTLDQPHQITAVQPRQQKGTPS